MNNDVKEALKVLIENNLNDEQINNMFAEFKKSRQENYEFKDGEEFYWVRNTGEILSNPWYDLGVDRGMSENFNAFPIHKKKQLEYLAKKQLLERKLFIYSDIHGAENINWNDKEEPKYYIVAGMGREENEFEVYPSNMHEWSWFNDIYFNTREDAVNALEDNEDLIKEVLRMQRELYKK
jgi:hypothetical protein